MIVLSDPMQWSVNDVQSWVLHMCDKYSVMEVDINVFQFDGKCLCTFSENDFEVLSPNGGSQLYAQFQIWKTCK